MSKKLIRLTESDLHNIIKESVNKLLKEYGSRDIDDDNYFGGGLPNRFFDDEEPEQQTLDKITPKQISQLENCVQIIADIGNNISDDTENLFKATDLIDEFIANCKQ